MWRFLKVALIGFFALLGFSVFSLIVVCCLGLHNFTKKNIHDNKEFIVKIDLNNNITEAQPNLTLSKLTEGPSWDFYTLLLAIKQAQKDKRVKSIIIRGEESSLGLAQIQELRNALIDFKNAGKAVWFHIDSFNEYASNLKLYYLASAANTVMMQPTGKVALNGLYMAIPFFANNLKKIGIKPQIATREEYKDAYTSFVDENMKSTTSESIKLILDTCFNNILKSIAKEREINYLHLIDAIDNIYFINGSKAVSLHLIDHLLYWDQAIDKIKKSHRNDTAVIGIDQYYGLYLNNIAKKNIEEDSCVGLIYASGPISKDNEGFNPMMDSITAVTPRYFEQAVSEILNNSKIKAVVIRVDSPGGSAIATDSIAGQILRLKQKKIPVIVSMGNYAASGGYWIAAVADKVVADPLTITGSIGVIGGKFTINELLDKLDIPLGKVSSGPNAGITNMLEEYDEKQWGLVQNDIDDVYKSFIDVVAKGRNLSTEHVRQVAKGRVWLGLQAHEFGLVDQLGGLVAAVKLAKQMAKIDDKKEALIYIYPHQKTLIELIKAWLTGEPQYEVSIKKILFTTIKNLLPKVYQNNTLIYEPIKIY